MLARSGLSANITFVWDLEDFPILTKTQFHVILVGEFSLQYLKSTDSQKIIDYVSNGGGLVTTFRTECRGCYNQPTSCTDLKKQCLHNSFLSPMGLKIEDGSIIQVPLLEYSITDKMDLTEIVPRKYERKTVTSTTQSRFTSDYNAIVDGVDNITYPGSAYSSFRFS